MSRFNMADSDNYGNNNSGSFFTLKDDKDTAKVRFLYNTIDDVEGYVVHEIEVDGKKRYVNCLRNYNDPIDKCPFCAAQMKVKPKLFIKLYNEDAKECQIWERGKNYFQRIASLAAHYNPLVNQIVEVERSGKKGDMQTTYEFYPTENKPVNLDDYECAEPLGTIILDKTEEEMNEFINTGSFPATANSEGTEKPPFEGSEVTRRTPGNTTAPRRSF